MKKITFYLMMLLGVTAFSQIEIVENFDGGLPAGWTNTGLSSSTTGACGGSGQAMSANLFDATTGTFTTPNYIGISNGTAITVNFSYNVFSVAFGFPPSQNPPPAGWGSIDLDYSTDGGLNWLNLTSVDDSDFTFVNLATCATASTTLPMGTIADGADVQVRASAINTSGTRLFFIIDNLSITQVADSAPNCDSTLTSPLNGSSDADIDVTLTWSRATGIATEYKVSVGTTSGGTEIANEVSTTETNLALSGLDYETLYYVNIVPVNSFGDAMSCTEESFTTRVAPIAGATCSNPLEILSFPYVEAAGDTNNYENNIDVSPCNNGYMSGKDVFYSITPTEDISINIDLANISNNGPSIHVVQGCPDVATECVAYVGTFNSGGALNLSEVVLSAENTYFIVLSNSSASRTYTYSLIIQRNSCINPTIASTANIADCGTGMFSVDVDVSYLGSATTLTLSDDIGSTADVTGINTTGLVNMGPYMSGTTVNFTLTNDDDSSCISEASSYFYCPPSNDECANPISLSVNTDDSCTLFISASNAGATESVTDPDTCASSNNNNNDVWFSFVATSTTTILEYLNIVSTPGYLTGGTIQATELLVGSCGSLTSVDCFTGDFVTLTNLTIGQTYYIRNNTRLDGEYAQNYDICLKEPPAAPVNDECVGAESITVSATVGTPVLTSGTTVGATTSANNSCNTSGISDVWYTLNPSVTGIYEISFAENPTNQPALSTFYVYEGSCANLNALSTNCNSSSAQVLSLQAGTDYYVMVQSTQTGPGVTFDLTVNRLPDAVANSDCSGAFTLTESVDMNGNNAISGNINVTDAAYYSAEGCASSTTESVWYAFTPQYTGMYNFNFTRVSGSASYTVYNTENCSQTGTAGYVTGISSCFNNTTPRTGDLIAGNTYLIMVHASSAAEYTILAYPDPSLSVESNTFETFKYYPNPVVNTLTIEAGNTISNVSIFNIVGQQVQVAKPNNLKTTVNMNTLEDGVYFVTVTINNAQKTFKVIKK